MVDESEDDYFFPLQNQRAFGAGTRRTQINFVSPREPRSLQLRAPKPGAGDRYLAIVLGQNAGNEGAKELQSEKVQHRSGDSKSGVGKPGGQSVCEICNSPILADAVALDGLETTDVKPHEASLVHQVCLEHSHPPSHLDRNRQGLKYLSRYGWDPDSRQGLGATGTGIRDPIKAKPKNNTLGVGAMTLAPPSKVIKLPPKKLDAKKVREAEVKGWEHRERLRNMFYQSDEVDRYLGSSG